MYKPYVQDVSDWISYYDRGGVSKQDSGGTGGVGAESGSTANPVEKGVRNNNKSIETEMRQGQLSSMPGQEVVQQTLANTLRRRRKRKSKRHAKFIKKRKKKKKKTHVKRRNGKKKKKKKKRKGRKKKTKRKTKQQTKSRSRRRKSKKQRDLFAE
jgi:hypothetical protein